MRTVVRLIFVCLILAGAAFAQCSANPVQGTDCASPVRGTVKPGQSPTSVWDFYPASVQWPCLSAPVGFFRLCATNGQIAVDVGDGKGYLNLRGRDGVDGKPGVIVGNIVVADTICVKGKGTVQAGWSAPSCTFKITAIH